MRPFTYIRTPLTDLTGMLHTCQDSGQCASLEMKVVSCLEAYGARRGYEKCADIIEDFNECFNMDKQNKRFSVMREERFRQYSSGERSEKELYADGPKVDSFQ